MSSSGRTAICGSEDTEDASPCQRSVPEGERCFMHDLSGTDSSHGAPAGNSNALGNDGGPPEGNSNAMNHGRHMTPERLRETFSGRERGLCMDLSEGHRERVPEYSSERAEEIATLQVMETRLSRRLLDKLSGSGERVPSRALDALRAYARDLRETEESARSEAWDRKVDILTGRGDAPDSRPDRLRTPEEPDTPASPDSPESASGPSAAPRLMADGSGEPPERRATDSINASGEDPVDEPRRATDGIHAPESASEDTDSGTRRGLYERTNQRRDTEEGTDNSSRGVFSINGTEDSGEEPRRDTDGINAPESASEEDTGPEESLGKYARLHRGLDR